jgi:hypothetical protein
MTYGIIGGVVALVLLLGVWYVRRDSTPKSDPLTDKMDQMTGGANMAQMNGMQAMTMQQQQQQQAMQTGYPQQQGSMRAGYGAQQQQQAGYAMGQGYPMQQQQQGYFGQTMTSYPNQFM